MREDVRGWVRREGEDKAKGKLAISRCSPIEFNKIVRAVSSSKEL